MRRGLYRIHGMDGRPDEVRVDDDGIEVPLAEQLYRDHKYLPLLTDLPWQEDYSKKPHEDLSDQQPVRTTVRGGLSLGDKATWGNAGRTPGQAGDRAAFRDRLGRNRK